MRKLPFLIALLSLLLVSSTVTGVSASKGWVKSENLPNVRHTAIHPGNLKICGDHKCGPFEDVKKSLQDKLKQNPSVQVKQPLTKNLFEKKVK